MNNDNNRNQPDMLLWRALSSYCSSGSLSKEDLREMIERYGLMEPNNDSIIRDTEFFFRACRNKRLTEEIIQYLLEYFPAAARATYQHGLSPLHAACYNPNVTLGVIRLLIDAAPASLRMAAVGGWMSLHTLCTNNKLDETTAVDILKLLIEKCPTAVRHADDVGILPIHVAAGSKPPQFCRLLIEAYPGSERIASDEGELPLHHACKYNTFSTVEYLYKLYPDAINHADTNGFYPIHSAINGVIGREDPVQAAVIAKFLLDCDPNVALQKWRGQSLLQIACWSDYYDSTIDAALEVINAIYDAHPEAIEDNRIALSIQRHHQLVQGFLNTQLVYARQAKDHSLMTTPDGSGQLPLHRALQNNVRLGSIKLLVRGNPHALRSPDNCGVLPLHIACQYHDSSDVMRYLIDIDTTTLGAADRDGNAALHHACRGAKYGTIATLLEDYDAVSVSRQNAHKKLPIDLLWESNAVEDRESIEYTESIFRLLKAYPETVMIAMMKEHSKADGCSTQNIRKRKFGK